VQDAELFELLARATLNSMHELSPHSLSDLTWAFAAARQPNAAAVLTAAAPAAVACVERFSAGMLADMMWSYASVGVRDEALLAAAAKVSARKRAQRSTAYVTYQFRLGQRHGCAGSSCYSERFGMVLKPVCDYLRWWVGVLLEIVWSYACATAGCGAT
jgi:hypothetical protein